MKLKNKIAVITGGNSGIGYGIAQEFVNEGAQGSIVGRNTSRNESALNTLGTGFISIEADVTETENLDNIFEQTEKKFGSIDILVVNAGGGIGEGTLGSVAETTVDNYEKMMDLNLKSVFYTVQSALPYLKDGASIILISSIAAQKAFPGMAVYSAAKAGVRSFARSFSNDLLERNIRVNVLSPGTIETPVFNKMGLPEEIVKDAKGQFEKLIPVQRIGQPQDLGKAAVFLASDDSTFILGEELIVDGGVVNL